MNRPAMVAVLIATYNRARLLGETLDQLALSRTDPSLPWEVVVVDNNSTDTTRDVVLSRQASFPVPLRYLFEEKQGRSVALNTAIGATAAPYLLFTDDDVRVEPGWLLAGVEALQAGADYVGGPVSPIWETPPPRWFDLSRGDLWGTIAICNYGRERFVYEERHRVPLGANMGVRSGREAVESATEALVSRNVIHVERGGRYRVRERMVLRYYARTIQHLLSDTRRPPRTH